MLFHFQSMWSVLKNIKTNYAIKRSRKSVPFFIYSDHRVLDQEQSSSVQGGNDKHL